MAVLPGIRYFVEFNDGQRVEVYDALDAIRRLDRPGRFTVLDDRVGQVETIGWMDEDGNYTRNPAFERRGDDGVTLVSAEDDDV